MKASVHEFPVSTYEAVARHVEGGHGLTGDEFFDCQETLERIVCGDGVRGMGAARRAIPPDWAVASLRQFDAAFIEEGGRVRLVRWAARVEHRNMQGDVTDTVDGSAYHPDDALFAAALRARGMAYGLPDTVEGAGAALPSRVTGGAR
jgi:hypothetical protein